jgi:hypothetical protein
MTMQRGLLYGKRLDAAWYMIILPLPTTSHYTTQPLYTVILSEANDLDFCCCPLTKPNHPTPSSWAKRRTWTFGCYKTINWLFYSQAICWKHQTRNNYFMDICNKFFLCGSLFLNIMSTSSRTTTRQLCTRVSQMILLPDWSNIG